MLICSICLTTDNPGYKHSDNSCVKIDLPANARFYGLGIDWICVRGFRRENQQCARVVVPANASIDIIGNDWICVEGFNKVDGTCILMAKGET